MIARRRSGWGPILGPIRAPAAFVACGVPVAISKARMAAGDSRGNPSAARAPWITAAAAVTIGEAPDVPPKFDVYHCNESSPLARSAGFTAPPGTPP